MGSANCRACRTGLIFLNLNLIVFGFVLLVYGISERVRGVRLWVENDVVILLPSNILIALGSATFFAAGFGLKNLDSFRAMALYAVLVLILSIFNASLAFSTEWMEEGARNRMADGLNQSLQDFAKKPYDLEPELNWTELQSSLRCCGVEGHSDWMPGVVSYTNPSKSVWLFGVPDSCFPDGNFPIMEEEDLERGDAFVEKNVFREGCLSKIIGNLGIGKLKNVGLILAVGKLFASISAIFLAHGQKYSGKNYG